VSQRTPGHDIRASGTPLLDRCTYSLNGSIALQVLRKYPLAKKYI
jgi:hypothetical protein